MLLPSLPASSDRSEPTETSSSANLPPPVGLASRPIPRRGQPRPFRKALATDWILGLWGGVTLAMATAVGAVAPLLLDDYAHPVRNGNGVDRLLIDDRVVGSRSRATQTCTNGVLRVTGDLVPGRGVPAFISQVSLLSADGKPRDLGGYRGVRLRVKVIRGLLCVQVASTAITNFDYHTGTPIAGKGGQWQEVRVPFQDMRRAWSEQVRLDPRTITSVNLVSFGMAPDAFAYEVDDLGFY